MSELWEHIDLCSGIGGFSLGFQWAELSEPILFCELDEFCQKILKKHWPDVPIFNDVKELANDTNAFIPRPRGRKRILTGGYPCQSFSQAGKRLGWEDPRAIWPYIFRIVQQERPNVCVFENVSGHISLGLDEVLHDLEGEGYTTRTFVLPAEACGASHRRDRLWIIARNMADTNSKRGCSGQTGGQDAEDAGQSSGSEKHGGRNTQRRLGGMVDGLSPWMDEPVDIPRVASGQKNRTHRLKALGNAIVPQIAQRIGIAIKETL